MRSKISSNYQLKVEIFKLIIKKNRIIPLLTILTWLWKKPGSRTEYTADHVNIWAAMVSRHLTIPHRIACVTDIPDGIDQHIQIIKPPGEFEGLETPTWNGDKPNCFRRLAMFRPDAKDIFGEKFVCMDLDSVIAANIDHLFDNDEDFMIYKGTSFDRPYNGSLMMIKAGSRPQVYLDFSEENAIKSGQKYVGSDQAWISYCLGPNEKTWSFKEGICWWQSQYNAQIDIKSIMFFPGQMKPWEAVKAGLDNWIIENYKGEKKNKRCAILGYHKKVWTDLNDAIEEYGLFDDYIISPEVKEFWGDNYLDIAATDNQAIRLAKMHGYEDFVFCGRSDK